MNVTRPQIFVEIKYSLLSILTPFLSLLLQPLEIRIHVAKREVWVAVMGYLIDL